MAEISAALVKELRELTGLPMMDCLTVLKFVSMPPSQRWSTQGIMQR